MGKEKILIIEDEENIQELIRYNLEKASFNSLYVCDNGEEGFLVAAKFQPDLILLDRMLPGIDGLTVCRNLKADKRTSHIPVIMLTAKSEEYDIVVGLEMGADDYITKPFSPKVLVARINSVLRRAHMIREEQTSAEEHLERDSLSMDRNTRKVEFNGETLNLTYSEFEILFLLARRPGWVFTRNQIVNAIKGDDYPVTERSIDVQIVGLRRKLGDSGNLIETVRGVGYRFKAS